MLLRLVGLTLLVAGLARAAGVSAAVGAFLVGLALPASFAERARAVMRPLRDLFAATFFVAFGLSTDPAALFPVLPAVLLLALVTIATKVATGWFAARRPRLDGRAGDGLAPRVPDTMTSERKTAAWLDGGGSPGRLLEENWRRTEDVAETVEQAPSA